MMIKRYDPTNDDTFLETMEESSSGDYVTFDDYEDAIADAEHDLKELQKKYDKLLGRLGEIVREG